MKLQKPVLLAYLATTVAAQNLFSSLLSEAGSIFTQVTSALGNTNTATSSSSTTTSSSSSSTDSSTTSSSGTNSASAAATSSLSTVPSTTSSSPSASSTSSRISSTTSATSSVSATSSRASSAAAQSASTTAAASTSGGGNSNTLPIVLGCTLGALALAALLALFFLCRRRRRRTKATDSRHRPLSTTDDDFEAWRHEKPSVRSSKTPIEHATPMGTHAPEAPLMSEHPHNSQAHGHHQNPFAPIPPPARRSNSRAGLRGPAYYSTQPFSADDYHPQNGELPNASHEGIAGHHAKNHDNHHAVAAGVGGLALGGLAAHAVNKHEREKSNTQEHEHLNGSRDPAFSEVEHNTLPESIHRRSGSVSRASIKEPWPFMDARERRSTESARSRARSFSRSRDRVTTSNEDSAHKSATHSAAKTAGIAAVGGLVGAAVARKSKSKSPHRKSILKQTTSDSSNPVSISSDGTKNLETLDLTAKKDFADGPHELATSDYPPAPVTRERRNSALGTAAPPAAIGSYVDEKKIERPRNRRSGSGDSGQIPVPPLPLVIPTEPRRTSADLTTPAIPNRSPRRQSLTPNARYSTASEGTAEMPAHSVERPFVSPQLDPQRHSDNGGLVSPVSPIIGSHSRPWSQPRAEQIGMPAVVDGVAATGARPLSQDSTAVVTPEAVSESSSDHSAGLVSAIQKIFGVQKATWTDQNDVESIQPHRRMPADLTESYHNPVQSIPHRKPAPNRYSLPPNSYPGEFDANNNTLGNVPPGAWTQSNSEPRHSNESARSFPHRHRSRGNSLSRTTTEPTNLVDNNTSAIRRRSHSRPGYGFGSGDPFDLATKRNDSNMTGISLSSYQTPPTHPQVQPGYQRPAFSNRESSSSDYREPTLAELRKQVAEEDKMKARQQWRRSRSVSAGRRHGDDGELFDLAMPDYESSPFERERIYGPEKAKKRSLEQERSSRNSDSSVGWAY